MLERWAQTEGAKADTNRQQSEPRKVISVRLERVGAIGGHHESVAALLNDLRRVGEGTVYRFKQRVRKLKGMGLTESLDVGYRLSPRGARVREIVRLGKSTT